MDSIGVLDSFHISHAQQASGHNVMRGLFPTKNRSVLSNICMCNDESASGKLGGQGKLIDERRTDQGNLEEGSFGETQGEAGDNQAVMQQSDSSVRLGQEDQSVDWRVPLIRYIQNPGDAVDRKILH
jgi:hypothetical protein